MSEVADDFDPMGTEIAPQPGPQTILLATDCEEVFFGGALMAGKSYALGLALENQHQKAPVEKKKHVSGIIFRQSVPELDDLIKTFISILEPFGWEWLVGKKTFRHPDGAECRMRHLEDEKDMRKYWGHQYCVGKGTPILMADGTYKPIEKIAVGDYVMTLEGPKRVKGLMPGRMSECVKAEVFNADGQKLGEQIQPSKHPILSDLTEWRSYETESHSQNTGRIGFPVILHAPDSKTTDFSASAKYVHPYTGENREVTESISHGHCELTPAGVHEVFDLSVEDANHYITASGLVNKNTFMGVDELGDFPKKTFEYVQRLRAARLRSAHGIPIQFIGTANPCGQGHKECKERYIDPAPPFTPFKDPKSKHNCIFIPGRMENNIKALLNDPEYRERCKSMGPDWYVQALINGDWSINPEGNMFHREWFNNFYNPLHLPVFDFIAISWDTAFKTTKESAESAATVWGVTANKLYLLDAWSGKIEFPELVSKTKALHNAWNAQYNWVEDKASGPSLIQTIKTNTTIPVRAIKVDGDKQRRAFSVTPYFESGMVMLPEFAPWRDKYTEQLCSFPAPTGYADLVDSTSQAINEIMLIKKRREKFGWTDNVIQLPKTYSGV